MEFHLIGLPGAQFKLLRCIIKARSPLVTTANVTWSNIKILMSLQLVTVLSKRKYVSSSDESIENLLYFKDCQHNKNEEPSSTVPSFRRLEAPLPPKAMDCPFPKMCCALTCGNTECGSASPVRDPQMLATPMERSFPPIKPNNGPPAPRQPPSVRSLPSLGRKKKARSPMRLPHMGGRRDFGFSKDKIKSLINQDDDIRKILKDLVRVTMQKVDLVDMINAKKSVNVQPTVTVRNSAHYEDDYDEDDDHLE